MIKSQKEAIVEAYNAGYERGKSDALTWISVDDKLPSVLEHVLLKTEPYAKVVIGCLMPDNRFNEEVKDKNHHGLNLKQ